MTRRTNPLTLVSPAAAASNDPTNPARHSSDLAGNYESLVWDAYRAGREQGEAQHFREGWRWGVVCGGVATLLVGAAALLWAGLL